MDVDIHPTWQELSGEPHSDADTVYVLIDVYKFSSTVIELIANGADSVRPIPTPDWSHLLHNSGVIGGEIEQYEDGTAELYNSPTFVGRCRGTYDGETVYFFSKNGARAAVEVFGEGSVVLCSTTNVGAVARFIEWRNPERVEIVCAGSLGRPAYEDLLAASLLRRRVQDLSVLSLVRDMLRYAPSITSWFSDTGKSVPARARLDAIHATRVNRSTVVPYLDDGQFVEIDEVYE